MGTRGTRWAPDCLGYVKGVSQEFALVWRVPFGVI